MSTILTYTSLSSPLSSSIYFLYSISEEGQISSVTKILAPKVSSTFILALSIPYKKDGVLALVSKNGRSSTNYDLIIVAI
jgi:hypothetical protein